MEMLEDGTWLVRQILVSCLWHDDFFWKGIGKAFLDQQIQMLELGLGLAQLGSLTSDVSYTTKLRDGVTAHRRSGGFRAPSEA